MSKSGGTGAHLMARFVASIDAKGIDVKDLAGRINKRVETDPLPTRRGA